MLAGLGYAFIVFKGYGAYVNNKNIKNGVINGQIIGGDKDEGGCLVAAGYSWCEIKQKCLHTREESCGEDFSQAKVENYIKANISILSPEKEVLGGKFYVTRILFINNDKVHIEYEDGHIALVANANFQVDDNNVVIKNFSILDDVGSMSGKNDDLSLELKGLFAEKYTKNIDDIAVTIEKRTNNFARGKIRFTDDDNPGNRGVFFAAQKDGQWQIVFDGNGLPGCHETDRFGFPAEVLTGCVNEEGEFRNNNWEQIKNAIINCQVEEVAQFHSQYVSAKLKDGSHLEGVEPLIDDIIDLAVASQEKCGKILMATE